MAEETALKSSTDGKISSLKTKMAVLVDTTRCTGCRGCQVACKQWHKKEAEKTEFTGTYENPPDLSKDTLTRVKFREVEEDGVNWLFKKIQCRHCDEPGCIDGQTQEVLKKYENGMVIANPDVKINEAEFESIRESCLYNVPRYDAKNKRLIKCTFCWDRQLEGRKPACVTACPTGTLTFGKRKDITAEANRRKETLSARFPGLDLITEDSKWIYLVQHNNEFGDDDG